MRIRQEWRLKSGRIAKTSGITEAALTFWKRDEIKEVACGIIADINWRGADSSDIEAASSTQVLQKHEKAELIRWVMARLRQDWEMAQSWARSPLAKALPHATPETKAELTKPVTPEPEVEFEPSTNGDSDLAEDFRKVLERVGFTPKAGVDRAEVEQIVEALTGERISETVAGLLAEWEKRQVTRIEVFEPKTGEVKYEGIVHQQFEAVRKVIARGIPLMLVGPAGGGKTQLIHQVCESLGRTFRATSFGPQTSQSELKGYMNANGAYVPTEFRKAFESKNDDGSINELGSVFLADEFDAGNAGVGTSFNAGLSNSGMGFPDGFIKRALGVSFAAALNTFGRGCDRQYVGRNQLDGATLDRFVVIELEYDEALERALALAANPKAGAWVEFVQKCRQAAFDFNSGKSSGGQDFFRHIISPRASINGATLLLDFPWPEVEKMALWKGYNAAEVSKVKALAGVA